MSALGGQADDTGDYAASMKAQAIDQFNAVEGESAMDSMESKPSSIYGEPEGFIKKYSSRLENQTKQMVQTEQGKAIVKNYVQHKDVPMFSQKAPAHKGIMARVAEREAMEEHQQDLLDKHKLMMDAISDPSFQSQVNPTQMQ